MALNRAQSQVAAPRKVLLVFGTRPEAIKLAPVLCALEKSSRLRPVVCVTGQHREMLTQMLSFFGIRPAHDLGLMQPDQNVAELGARIQIALDAVLASERPDAVLVQGDTATTFNAALAAHHRRIPCGHVEAGLRSFDAYDPFPEEVYRRLTTHVAAWHFAPTAQARTNLLREGIAPERIAVTGNTVVDALQQVVASLERAPVPLPAVLPAEFLAGRRLLLATGHRRESFGAGLEAICRALRAIAERREDVAIVYPVHLNPSVREPVLRLLGDHPRIALTPPLDYLAFVDLMRRAYLILTDSGGVQEEAPALGKPVLVMRSETERPEAIWAGVVKLVGPDRRAIVEEATRLLDDAGAYASMARGVSPYGDGKAAARIAAILKNDLVA